MRPPAGRAPACFAAWRGLERLASCKRGRQRFFLVRLSIRCYDSKLPDGDGCATTRGHPIMAEPKTILIVDDDPELSDGLRIMLERRGYRVLQARDGQQGKSLIYQ